MSDFDFSAASEAAAQHLSQPSDSSVTPTPSGDAGGESGLTPPQTPPAQEPAGQQIFKVKDQGKEVEVTLDELLSGHLRHRDYTKKTMEVAEQRKQMESFVQQAQQREQQMNDFLRDAKQVAAYYQYMTGQQITPQEIAQQAQDQGIDPSAAVAQMRQELLGEVQKVQDMTKSELAKFQQAQVAARAADFERDITSTIKSLLGSEEFDALKDIGDDDEIGDFLCSKAMQMGPRNIEEAKDAIMNVAKAKLEHISSRRKEMLKKSAVQSAQLSKSGIEPPGGTGVTPKASNHKLGSKELTSAATQWLESLNKK